jgi:hypothetical protein
MWYSYESDMLLSGWSHMKLLGAHDRLSLSGLSDSDMRSLAGEGFAAPCATQVLIAYYSNVFAPWW